ncbi:MAG: putative toxin-antitoxin system toxin component, PIN family [Burkholderiales bacterium]|uniref:Toxin-antitoxin system toxin component, PIN family n=1 Tax=Ottowia pentelensis TaxID=511108 RepID=A0ABV6PNW3_9BURK|nr:putative toxin-antitoxin system toxin component, PIN family [Ottowia sp.]MBN9404618.1 putative toxin-antitoxin system toxin component, PIN family [Burkholderiales bacterium]MBS0400876.1 putative toxin-antitoxin system toxin component, PIN family [Pseudomonadota bacterium]MBS0415283.1 putative toxin-antitoxin system toxin component, PIN family [Pseudomonadota bacterium]
MSRSARVVLDTNVLVSAALRPHSVPWQALDFALAAGALVACDQSIAELQATLLRPKFDRYATRERRAEILALIRAHAVFVTVAAGDLAAAHGVCRDPDDELFLSLALAARAGTIVSGDTDLLALHPWRGIGICTAAAYLAM